ncbi:Leucyl-cystinyl aminopeptidase [Trachymyrmex septentrionalis]|uniref:Aminopeptidase n=1 Tax=Trachymyrmex septentrionalis TaxID=34720 RepID=A0A195FT77_9HYME|nr:Leucyl-cystinyl aminopeptidase [Trachymyrmex septentrionalis]
MTFLKLLLKSNLIFFVTTIVTGENSENSLFNYHLPYNIIALHYKIQLTLPRIVENYTFYGESNINIIVRHPTQEINLHSVFVDINKQVTLFHEISKRIYKSSGYTCNYGLFTCSFNFNDLITVGSYMLKLKYNGTISDRENADGFIITSYKDGQRNLKWMYSAGDFQNTVGVQYVFPVINDLMFKATFDITVDYPKNYTALSNMPVISRKHIKNHMKSAHFHTTPAIHPYLVAIIVADLDTLYTKSEKVPLLYRDLTIARQLYFALDVAETTTMYLKDQYFQNCTLNDYIPQTNYVAIPYYRDDGLPNWGIVFYSQEAISYLNEWNSIQRKTEVAALVARKVANQFLNKITLSSWSDMWINEGIATFLGTHVVDKIFTDLQMMDLFVVRTRCESLRLESVTNMPPVVFQIKEPYDVKLFGSFRYNKAFALLRMLYHIISDEVFHKSICNYLNNHDVPVESTSANNLWAVMQTILNESNNKTGLNITKMMNFWITQHKYPILKVTRNYGDGRTVIWTDMHNMSKRHEWWIPVTYTTETNLNFNIAPFVQKWITCEQFFVYLPSINLNDWIIVNLQQLVYPHLMDLFVVKFQHESLRLNDYYNMSLIHETDTSSDIDSIFSITHYIKGSNYTEHIDVKTIFTQWTKQKRYPMLEVQRISFLNKVKVYVVEPCPENLSIPVTYITQTNPHLIHNAWLEKSNLDLPVYSSDWIIINIQQIGKYNSINMLCFYI